VFRWNWRNDQTVDWR